MMTPEELSRFNAKWTQQGTCQIWLGTLDRDGYGNFFLRQRNRRAHRVGYFSKHGEIGEGLIGHTCRNRACVNPDHLKIVTHAENALENSLSVTAGNAAKTHCPQGHPYDSFETSHGRKQRVCSICRRAKQNAAAKRRRDRDTLAV